MSIKQRIQIDEVFSGSKRKVADLKAFIGRKVDASATYACTYDNRFRSIDFAADTTNAHRRQLFFAVRGSTVVRTRRHDINE